MQTAEVLPQYDEHAA